MGATIRGSVLRGVLNVIARGALRSGITLREALEAFQDQISAGTVPANGRLILGTSGNSYSVNFQGWINGYQLTPDRLLECSQLFLEVYDAAVTTLGNSDSDAATLSTMLAQDDMQSIKEARSDVTLLRWPTYGPTR